MSKHLGIAILFAVLLGTAAASAAGPREPLTFRNTGLYCGWNDYLISRESPFDFLLIQATCYQGRSNAAWAESLSKARQNGKRVIAVLNPQAKNAKGEDYGISELTSDSDEHALKALLDVAEEFLSQVDEKELYAITLAEEHIFWNGRTEHLNWLYEHIKQKHEVPVFQWFSPSSKGSIPGLTGWPNLKADGWVADEYHLDQPYMERAMRGYTVQQKPIIQIVWAGGDKTSIPFDTRRFWEQIEVCRKYNIPTAYFTWWGQGSAWGWSEDAPLRLKERFESALQVARRAKDETERSLHTLGWDFVPWDQPAIELAFSAADDRTAAYEERYDRDKTLRFVNDAQVRGFADVRWDSSAVELRPREAGKRRASICYAFQSAFAVRELRAVSTGFAKPGTDAVLTMSVMDWDGRVLGTGRGSETGEMKLVVSGDKLNGRRFRVELGMSGTASVAGEALAGVSAMSVEADVDLPEQRVIELQPDSVGGVTYVQDLASMSLFHTAEVRNPEKLRLSSSGLHAGDAPGALEVVQKFRAPGKVKLKRLCIEGIADGPGQGAKIGLGVSLDGSSVLVKKMSQGSFNGELEIDAAEFQHRLDGNEFFLHLYCEGRFGLISSYALDGDIAQ